MRIKINTKPLSINECWQGRRFKTAKANNYDKLLQSILPKTKIESEFYEIQYKFYLDKKRFLKCDVDNLIKVLQDNLVKKGIIRDDRYILKIIAEKCLAEKNEFIEIQILDYNKSGHNSFEVMEF